GVQGRFVTNGAQLAIVGAPFAAWSALQEALHEVLAVSGVLRLHAAVVQVDTATLALLGPSGRGKSTTLVRAAAMGWRPVSEDAVFLDLASLTVVGADERDHVRLRVPGHDGRLEIGFAELGGRVPSASLTHLVHLVRGRTSVPRWSELSRADAVMALHEAMGMPTSR